MNALKADDFQEAERIRQDFLAFESLRDTINPIRVLHDGVTLAGIADMGPVLPLLSNLDQEQRDSVAPTVRVLAALSAGLAGEKAA